MPTSEPSGEILQDWTKTIFYPRKVSDLAGMLGISRSALYQNWFSRSLSPTQIRRIFAALKREEIPPGQILQLAQMLQNHPDHEQNQFLPHVISKKGDVNSSGDGTNIVSDSPHTHATTDLSKGSDIEQLAALLAEKDKAVSDALEVIKAQLDEMKELRLMLKDALKK